MKEVKPGNRVVAVLMSDRIQGMLPTLGTMVDFSSSSIEVLLIGDMKISHSVQKHFEGRIDSFILMTVEDLEADLLSQGINPIWKWNDFGSSHGPDWQNENTIHLAEWDGLATHENILNHARFYLPYLSALQHADAYFLIDDDIIVKADIGKIAKTATEKLVGNSTGLVCPCNIWRWDGDCSKFVFKDRDEKMLDSSPIYGSAPNCTSETQKDCVPESYRDFLETVTPATKEELEQELAWNFGFCFVPRRNWLQLNLTQRYESVMKASYKDHVFPENSLAFGLGVAYLAFVGSISCWGETAIVRDGFSFVDPESYHEAFGKDYIGAIDVIHYTGPFKPWEDYARIRHQNLKPWLDAMERENMDMPKLVSKEPTKDVFTVLTSWRSGSEWVFDMLDQHPDLCASGESFNPQRGFPTEAMNVFESPWLPVCSSKKGCQFQFVMENIQELTSGELPPPRCKLRSSSGNATYTDPLPHEHLVRLCNFIDVLQGDYSQPAVVKAWVDAFVTENQDLMGCSCPLGNKLKGLKLMNDWIINAPKPPKRLLNLNETAFAGSKLIRFRRANLFERFKSLVTAQQSNVWHARSAAESVQGKQQRIHMPVDRMLQSIRYMDRTDRYADDWAQMYASDVLWIVYEDCREAPLDCFNSMFDFLGVPRLDKLKGKLVSFKKGNKYQLLDNIENKEEVRLALKANGWGHFVGESSSGEDGIGLRRNIDDLQQMERKVRAVSPEQTGGQVDTSIMPIVANIQSAKEKEIVTNTAVKTTYSSFADNGYFWWAIAGCAMLLCFNLISREKRPHKHD
eukprot:Nitzschia sp. Nitz4//scaffold441_size7222//3174//5670//NITZ4_009161-RA/size7222-processed-gene-0.0-mRNA-1//1//CDS//3329552025//6057//frame0